jgi:hypothetical protein
MNADEDPEKLQTMVAEKGVTWTQATYASIKELVQTRFRIRSWPTYLLLDGQRKIIVAEGDELRGENLAPTLEKLLP